MSTDERLKSMVEEALLLRLSLVSGSRDLSCDLSCDMSGTEERRVPSHGKKLVRKMGKKESR